MVVVEKYRKELGDLNVGIRKGKENRKVGKLVLKHAWFPVRQRWHIPTQDLVFGTEEAYRFVKRIIDGNASVTLANTIDYGINRPGFMMADEMAIMKKINERLLSDPIPDYEAYKRSEGAYLVNE